MNYQKSFGFRHKSGILLPVSALPSRYGIGSFGKAAFDFISFLEKTGQKCWQVLPLNPTSYGDSPYQSPASLSGNPYFIDLDILKDNGLLTDEECQAEQSAEKRINYGRLFETRYEILRRAYARFVPNKDYTSFTERECAWLRPYALFMALKVKNAYVPWYEWDEGERDYTSAKKLYDTLPDVGFFTWLQYEFDRQWHSVLNFAHKKGIVIIGDMPIYVAHDSADVWCDPKSFLLDDEYMPTTVAGCPPDAYSEDGQLWGNPIYDWERMRNDGFTWWLARIERAFKLYDILRIDHFRGFASYYSIPYGDENAKRGEWIEAPGLRLFRRVREVFPKARIIAEDLGLITDDVRDLLRRTEFPGMKLLQFAFFEDDNEYLPRTYKHSNSVVYTASHDSDCTRSWAKELDAETRARFLRECPLREGESECAALVRLAMESRSNLCIIPMQDYLEQTNARGRINTPSVPYGNWTYRLSKSYATRELREKILKVTDASGRRA